MLFDDLNKVDIPAAWPNEARYFIPGPYLLTHRQQRINQPERARQTPSLVHRSDFQPLSTSSRPEPQNTACCHLNRLSAGTTRTSTEPPAFFLPKISGRGCPPWKLPPRSNPTNPTRPLPPTAADNPVPDGLSRQTIRRATNMTNKTPPEENNGLKWLESGLKWKERINEASALIETSRYLDKYFEQPVEMLIGAGNNFQKDFML